jgi:hypothetical protein
MEWVRRENAEQRGQRSCRLSIGDGSWSVMAWLRTPLQPASGWPSHCTIWAKHGGIASTLRTLLTSPLGLVRCPSPKMPGNRVASLLQCNVGQHGTSVHRDLEFRAFGFDQHRPRGLGERSTAVHDRSGVAFLKNGSIDLAVASDRSGFVAGRQRWKSTIPPHRRKACGVFWPGSENRHRGTKNLPSAGQDRSTKIAMRG